MKQPILELWLIYGLLPHAPNYDHCVHYSADTHEPPEICGHGDRLPWSAQKRRHQQNGAEMNDRRRCKRGTGLWRAYGWPLGDERHDDKLQSDQGARGRSDTYIEAIPFGHLRHDAAHPLCACRSRALPFYFLSLFTFALRGMILTVAERARAPIIGLRYGL